MVPEQWLIDLLMSMRGAKASDSGMMNGSKMLSKAGSQDVRV